MKEKEKLKAAFDQIRAEEELKERTKEYLSEKVYARKKKRTSPLRNFAAAAACALLVFLAGGSYLYFTPTAYISVDVNPSLELGINRFDRIVSVTGYNEDGKALADSLDLKYMDYSDALEALLADQDMEVYLSDNADVVLTVAGKSESQSSQILETVESCVSDHENVHCHSGDTEEIHHAHNAGLSFGKYQAYLTLKELDPSVTLEEIQDMTMSQIRELIQAYSQEDSQGSSQGNSQGNSWKNSSDSTADSSGAAQESTGSGDSSGSAQHGHHGYGHKNGHDEDD
ncbi:MAG TPA: hypothetical protein H9913_10075 [Candidatus Blautia stercoripullorum]|uniref:Anti-sigma factor RsgI-like middle domain-containing protein n=1 Tax=Candidatus Blautia stercoripullorum TaxID=2838502 RepID=A0A9D2RAU1_9FIRM|nr:hypothetical protein [Candidatus Blautia stercoripullorum]